MALLGAGGVIALSWLGPACSSTSDAPVIGGALAGGAGGSLGNAGNTAGTSSGGSLAGGGGNLSVGGRGGTSAVPVEPGGAGGDDSGASGGAGDDNLGRDDACALGSTTVAALPPVLNLVVDISGSMDWPPGWAPVTPDDSKPPGETKWEITREALRASADSFADEVAVGMSFFPNTTDDDDESMCLRNEVALPIGVLGASSSSARENFEAALDAVVPNGATPTHGAYVYGVEQLSSSDLPGDRFLLLITDGTPTCTIDCECTEDNLPVDSDPLIAAAARARDEGIRTFVIGSPGSEATRDVLSALATEGGTATAGCSDAGPDYCHLDMTTEPDLADGLTRALEQVASSLRSCEYPVPPAPDDGTVDPGRVNVLFTPSGGETKTIPRAPSASDCQEGWHYGDDEETIVLCGTACEDARSDVGATVEVLLGCKTVIEEPR
jgi:hypothetical protein